jgi:transglutaminase-like putative cysteine protease
MDLTPYTARGFGEGFDKAMAEVPVKGIDLVQAHSMIRLCAETEGLLYGADFSPRRIRHRSGARPVLERIVAGLEKGGSASRGRVDAAMRWVSANVIHANYIGPLAPDRAMTEEQLIESGVGWCNEQSRVFIALCEVMEIPARLCFLFHANGRTAHTATEVFLDGKWCMYDVTYGVRIELPDGTLAEGREIQGRFRGLAHAAYRGPMMEYYRRGKSAPGANRADVETAGDFFEGVGICNYLTEGVEALQ